MILRRRHWGLEFGTLEGAGNLQQGYSIIIKKLHTYIQRTHTFNLNSSKTLNHNPGSRFSGEFLFEQAFIPVKYQKYGNYMGNMGTS